MTAMSEILPPNFRYEDLIRLCDDQSKFWHFLFDSELIGWFDEQKCPRCNHGKLKIRQDKSFSSDGGCWRCSFKNCGYKFSFRAGSWLSNSKLPIEDILKFTYQWVQKYEPVQIKTELQIADHTTVDWRNFCREVCEVIFLEEKGKIGGPGYTVEIDESKFGKRKYNRGRRLDGKWVFGGICRESGDCFFNIVEKRDANTLIPLIQEHILPGTTIISDCWAAYNGIEKLGLGYIHKTVNHSEHFVDPITGAHTQRIESTWHALKRHLFPRSGTQKHLYSTYFAEHCIRKKYLTKSPNPFVTFLELIKRVYKPSIPAPKTAYVPKTAAPTVQYHPIVAIPSTSTADRDSLDDFQL